MSAEPQAILVGYSVVGFALDGDVRVDRQKKTDWVDDTVVLSVSSADRPLDVRHARVDGRELRLTPEGARELIALLQKAVDS